MPHLSPPDGTFKQRLQEAENELASSVSRIGTVNLVDQVHKVICFTDLCKLLITR